MQKYFGGWDFVCWKFLERYSHVRAGSNIAISLSRKIEKLFSTLRISVTTLKFSHKNFTRGSKIVLLVSDQGDFQIDFFGTRYRGSTRLRRKKNSSERRNPQVLFDARWQGDFEAIILFFNLDFWSMTCGDFKDFFLWSFVCVCFLFRSF